MSDEGGRISSRMFEVDSITPAPVSVTEHPVARVVHWGTAIAAVSVVLGIVIGVGTIVGVVGKAFYVERGEYNVLMVRMAEDKARVDETFKRIDNSLARLETSMQKLADAVETLREERDRRRR